MDTKERQLLFQFDEEVEYEYHEHRSIICNDEPFMFDGIPLDKPLVPCVLLEHLGDSVELIT